MQNFLRISIFSICIAAGVGLAVSLATQMQPPENVAEDSRREFVAAVPRRRLGENGAVSIGRYEEQVIP